MLCEIQTDKAVVSMEVDDDAVLAKILVPEGTDNVKVILFDSSIEIRPASITSCLPCFVFAWDAHRSAP